MDIKKFFQDIYQKIIGINDSPHKVGGGFAVGVFFGILPGAGPLAAVLLAHILRVNRASAFVGGLLTNSWLSIVAFALAVKIGAFLTGSNWHEISSKAKNLFKHFSWDVLRDGSTWALLKPVMAGFAAIGLAAAITSYVIVFFVVVVYRHRKKKASI